MVVNFSFNVKESRLLITFFFATNIVLHHFFTPCIVSNKHYGNHDFANIWYAITELHLWENDERCHSPTLIVTCTISLRAFTIIYIKNEIYFNEEETNVKFMKSNNVQTFRFNFLCILNVHIKLPFIQIHTVTMLIRFKVQNIKYTYWISLYPNTHSNNAKTLQSSKYKIYILNNPLSKYNVHTVAMIRRNIQYTY